MTVKRLAAELGPGEFQEWLGFDRLEPHPDDVRTARLQATTMNAGGGKKGGKAFRAEEFLPQMAGKTQQTEAQMKAMFTCIFGPPKPAATKGD